MLNYNDLSFKEAFQIQLQLKAQLKFEASDDAVISTIAGADISYHKNSNLMYAAIVVLDFNTMDLQSYALATAVSDFPYKAGYLGFREVPALLNAWNLLPTLPDVLVLDGQGILHPRRMGIASHFGVLTNHPTIGCAKSALFGSYIEPSSTKYSSSEIFENDAHIGYALRTKDKTKPVFISPGYGLSLASTLQVMKKCVGNYRIPEPTRLAHEIVNQYRLGKLKDGFTKLQPKLELF